MDQRSRNEELADQMRAGHMSIPYPERRADFGRAEAVFEADALTIAGHPVMQGFQRGYMRELARVASSGGGDMLEIGYGMGLAARYFVEEPTVRTHTIVECHPDVLKRCLDDLRDEIACARVRIIATYWENAVDVLKDASFDGILFDTYPTTRADVELSHFPFFPHAHRLLRPGGVFTYYSDEADKLPPEHLDRLADAGFVDVEQTLFAMPAQPNPMYWQASTIVVPVARKNTLSGR
jgi:guanidinoacetate N-methyltransferase